MVRKYTEPILREAVGASESVAGVIRFLGLRQAGGTQAHLRRMIDSFGISTNHFVGQAHGRGKKSLQRKTAEQILILLPEGSHRIAIDQLRRAMTESGVEYLCTGCGNTGKWCGKPVQLEVDHIDGNWYNNILENLRFLCPNCHSQQPTNRSWKHAGVAQLVDA